MKYIKCVAQLVLVSVILLSDQGRVHGQIQYSRYELPSLYTFDDYDICFQRNTTELGTTYCMVYAEVKPDDTSELWRKIKAHKDASKFNYHYDRLFFGLCLERCQQYAQSARLNEKSSFTTNDIVNNEITQYFEQVHKRPLDLEMRSKYPELIYKCLNAEFEKKYNLSLRIYIEYCEGRHEMEQQIASADKDPVEIAYHKLFQVIALLVILSSLYDYCLKSRQTEENQTNEFYKTNLQQPVSRLLTSFSISRNYYRLIQPYRGVIGTDFAYLDGYRSVTTVMVIFGHTFWTYFIHMKNPEYFEDYSRTAVCSIILNTPVVIEIFMVMSGLFFYVKFTEARYVTPQTSLRKCVKIFVLLVASRYLRYLPSVALLVLVNATVMNRFVDGPFWRHISEQNRVFSRENWWKNIFMINNFSQKDTVSPHTWYIAADMQLFAFYSIMLILMSKYPQYKNRIQIYLGILTVAIPTCASYLQNMGSSFILKGESYRYGHFVDTDEYYYQYTPFYNNLGGYLFGFVCGHLYLQYLNKKEWQEKFRGVLKYEIGAYVAVPIAFGIFWIGSIMMFPDPSIWTAIYSGLNRNLWIVFVCGPPLLGMACKGGWVAYEFCCLPIFRVIARLSFQIYLWHFLILQMLKGQIRQPFHMSNLYLISLTIITFTAAAMLAFVIALFVEYPFAQLLETLQPKRRKSLSEPPKQTKVQ